MNDREVAMLIQNTLDGDPASFHPVVHEYTPALFNLAFKMCGDAQETEDIVQETFFRAYRDLGRWNPEKRFFNWLYGICVNVSYSAGKRRSRVRRRETNLAENAAPDTDPESNPAASLDRKTAGRSVTRALLRLPESLRAALLLRYQEDLPVRDVAGSLGIGLSAAKMRIRRGLEALRTLIEDQEVRP